MANVRAMLVFQAGTALPEDRFINTFHFSNGDSYAVHSAAIATALTAFINDTKDTNALNFYLSAFIERTAEIRTYNLADPEPRVPTIFPLTLPASAGGSVSIPEEVAIVVSFHGAIPVTARRRGRIYFGPLQSIAGVMTLGSATDPVRVGTVVIGDLITASADLATAGVGWCVRSSVPSQNFVPIVGGWVDNAFDTQRRRGPGATARSTWST